MTPDIEIIDQLIEDAGYTLSFRNDKEDGFQAIIKGAGIEYTGAWGRSTAEALESLAHYLVGLACERFVNLHKEQ